MKSERILEETAGNGYVKLGMELVERREDSPAQRRPG